MKNRINETNTNKQGINMKIIKYNDIYDIDIIFMNDGFISKNKTYNNFKNGNIKNPYYPSIYNVGYIGEGKYKSSLKGKQTKEYQYWHTIMKRCYDLKTKNRQFSYENCYVCNEWHNFQNFSKWFYNNYYEIEDERMEIDKDILVKGNKMYSPETCIFVPQRINSLFIKNKKMRGNYFIGVCFDKNKNKYKSHCRTIEGIKF